MASKLGVLKVRCSLCHFVLPNLRHTCRYTWVSIQREGPRHDRRRQARTISLFFSPLFYSASVLSPAPSISIPLSLPLPLLLPLPLPLCPCLLILLPRMIREHRHSLHTIAFNVQATAHTTMSKVACWVAHHAQSLQPLTHASFCLHLSRRAQSCVSVTWCQFASLFSLVAVAAMSCLPH
ncbi:hypothetical protein V8C42DRAFT_296725 [Trichoderma barbatum]